MRRAAKVDSNHSQIVTLFRDLGWRVLDLSAVGKGCPDILIQRGQSYLVEIKDGEKVPSARRLTPAQVVFHRDWKCYIIKSIDEVIDFSNSH